MRFLATEKTDFNLGRMPGPKVRSGVNVPAAVLAKAKTLESDVRAERGQRSPIPDSDSDDDLIIE